MVVVINVLILLFLLLNSSPFSSFLLFSIRCFCSFIFSLLWSTEMDYNPFTQSSNFVGLLNSQQSISFGSSQVPTPVSEDVGECRERRKWTPSDDILLSCDASLILFHFIWIIFVSCFIYKSMFNMFYLRINFF